VEAGSFLFGAEFAGRSARYGVRESCEMARLGLGSAVSLRREPRPVLIRCPGCGDEWWLSYRRSKLASLYLVLTTPVGRLQAPPATPPSLTVGAAQSHPSSSRRRRLLEA
jgi:hypothetical protein